MIEEMLARARETYAQKLKTKLEELAEAVRRARESLCPVALSDAQRMAHRLYGTAGTFGFEAVSEVVCRIDRALTRLKAGETSPAEAWPAILADLDAARALSV